jgi:hypothetical protein
MPASLIGGASSPDAIVTNGGASIPISQPTPRRYRSPMAVANAEPTPCPRWARAHARCDGELETTISSSETEYAGDSSAAAKSPSRALESSARLPGCTRAITIGTGSSSPGRLAQKTISSPSSGFTDWTRSVICFNSRPVSEFHQAPNVAFWADCSSARERARSIVSPGFGIVP